MDVVELAGKYIRDLKIRPLNTPHGNERHNVASLETLCPKCSKWIHDEEFSMHWDFCPWICGLCGLANDTETGAQEHQWRCANQNLRKGVH